MARTELSTDVRKLILQIERDLLAQSHLKKMLIEAGATLRARRNDLRVAKGRLGKRAKR